MIANAGLEEALKEMGGPTLIVCSDGPVPGKLVADELKTLDKTKTAHGENLEIDSRGGLWINEAKVVSPDLERGCFFGRLSKSTDDRPTKATGEGAQQPRHKEVTG